MGKCVRMKCSSQGIYSRYQRGKKTIAFGNASFRKLKNMLMVEFFFKKISLFRTKTSFLLFSGGYPCVILSTIKISLALTSLLVSSKEPMVVWLGKKDPWPLIVSTFPMAVFLIRAVSGAISSHPFHSVGKQRLFYKHFLGIFNVLGLGQDVGDPFMSKKWALS